ncbi:MAG: hypothetical protein ABEJ03_02405 [Candidatus Nanohaloarchaea archaeon]
MMSKEISEGLEIRGGERLSVGQENGSIFISREVSAESLKELKGCLKSPEVEPMETSDMWGRSKKCLSTAISSPTSTDLRPNTNTTRCSKSWMELTNKIRYDVP